MKYAALLALAAATWLAYDVYREEVDGQVDTMEIELRAQTRNHPQPPPCLALPAVRFAAPAIFRCQP